MVAEKPLVPVIVGPTAVGKTAVVMELARRWTLIVISADSRQIYRGLDIGTAKPTLDQLRAVRHMGIDVVEPGERYSAGRFAREAASWLREVSGAGQAVVVGGTGFYIRALADGLFREPPMDAEKRGQLRNWTRNAEALASWAARLDPSYAGGGRQRAARTVEVALLTGRPLSWWQQRAKAEGVMRPWYVRLTVPRPVLHARIEERVHRMLSAGLVDEVRAVLNRGIPPEAPGLDAVGYREVVLHLQGQLGSEALAPAIVTATKRYAKRQETWLRHQLGDARVLVLDATAPSTLLAERIGDLWEEQGQGCG